MMNYLHKLSKVTKKNPFNIKFDETRFVSSEMERKEPLDVLKTKLKVMELKEC